MIIIFILFLAFHLLKGKKKENVNTETLADYTHIDQRQRPYQATTTSTV